MTVFNESDFVDYAIRACLPYVDDLVIVEGSYQETISCGAEPRSTDGTKEAICKATQFNDPLESSADKPFFDERVYYIEANEISDKDQRNVGLAKIKKLNPDGHILIIDGDEIYTKENFKMVRNLINSMEKQDYRAAIFTSLTFVNDLDHYTIQEFPRLFKITPECKFVNDNHMEWEDAGWNASTVLKAPYIQYHHYAFCKGTTNERFELKKRWWETRFGKPFDYGWHVNADGKIDDPNHKITKYTGRHPKIMDDHPLRKKNA